MLILHIRRPIYNCKGQFRQFCVAKEQLTKKLPYKEMVVSALKEIGEGRLKINLFI
jgi:hypothetical protein